MQWSGGIEEEKRQREERTDSRGPAFVKCDEGKVQRVNSPFACCDDRAHRAFGRIVRLSTRPFLHDPKLYRDVHQHLTGRTSSVADRTSSCPQSRRMMSSFVEASMPEPMRAVPDDGRLPLACACSYSMRSVTLMIAARTHSKSIYLRRSMLSRR